MTKNRSWKKLKISRLSADLINRLFDWQNSQHESLIYPLLAGVADNLINWLIEFWGRYFSRVLSNMKEGGRMWRNGGRFSPSIRQDSQQQSRRFPYLSSLSQDLINWLINRQNNWRQTVIFPMRRGFLSVLIKWLIERRGRGFCRK